MKPVNTSKGHTILLLHSWRCFLVAISIFVSLSCTKETQEFLEELKQARNNVIQEWGDPTGHDHPGDKMVDHKDSNREDEKTEKKKKAPWQPPPVLVPSTPPKEL